MKVAADFRKEAREALRGKWFLAVLVGLAASLLGVTGHDILTLQFENTQRNAEVNVNLGDATIYSMGRSSSGTVDAGAFLMEVLPYVILVVLVVVVFQLILGSIVAVGYAKFNLDLVDGEEAKAHCLTICPSGRPWWRQVCCRPCIFFYGFCCLLFRVLWRPIAMP